LGPTSGPCLLFSSHGRLHPTAPARAQQLSCNKLVGPIPKTYEQLSLLDDLQLNGNRLTGKLEGSSLVGMASLTRINLDGNLLTEKLPLQVRTHTHYRACPIKG